MDNHLFEKYLHARAEGIRIFRKEDLHIWDTYWRRLKKEIKEIRKYDSSCSLRKMINIGAYISIVEYYLSRIDDCIKISIVAAVDMYSGDKIDISYNKTSLKICSIIEYTYKNYSRKNAALVVCRMIGIYPENCFNVFYSQEELFMDGYRLKTKVSDEYIPKCLSVYGKIFFFKTL